MSRPAKDYTGQTRGLLTIQSRHYPNSFGNRRIYYLCRCACGKQHIARQDHLTSGHSSSCGCYRDLRTRETLTTHGGSQTTEYRSWLAMLHRCYNPAVPGFPFYGAKGVTVCDRWRESFANFLEDMGPKPGPDYSLDRENPFGIYEKTNCRWADRQTQAENKRANYEPIHPWQPIDSDIEF